MKYFGVDRNLLCDEPEELLAVWEREMEAAMRELREDRYAWKDQCRRDWMGKTVRPVSGAWECGCTDEDGTVTKVEVIDEVVMGFVGTPCGWSWIPLLDLLRK